MPGQNQQPQTVVNVNMTPSALGTAPLKSVGVAVLLWFFLGSFGAHRFYLNRPHAFTIIIVHGAAWFSFGVGVGLFWLPQLAVPFFVAAGVIWVALVVWLLVDVFSLAGWAREYGAPASPAAQPPNLQASLIKAAEERNGRLTAAGAAAATGRSLSEVENALSEMEVGGHVECTYEAGSTVPVYVFHGLA